MSARSKARKRAIDLLYGADLRELPIWQLLGEEATRALDEPDRRASWEYAKQIVEGVDDNKAEIDRIIAEHAQGWTLDRMPVLDRAIARVGAWEILYNAEVPDGVAISEAVESATVLSTDDSAGFLNGLLAAVARVPKPEAAPHIDLPVGDEGE
ncbi:transcription antitermination factor NusB [Schumannella sp. 10F1B-5-1]|uniref:transcription antitermination factor NusB n=1 Tax=Schumannella sp. 10F1B-5-1 TaxID=2590780 RepID=UPI0011314C50|nr:transcription antitermination factor NusB [Schumannella sp. 10F1B-5-1]TPW71040.1 transcription antitermination factor NusB [Schumannella sp. 10F1B-5-1]